MRTFYFGFYSLLESHSWPHCPILYIIQPLHGIFYFWDFTFWFFCGFEILPKLLYLFFTLPALSWTMKWKVWQITFVWSIKLRNLSKNGFPRVNRSQNTRISKWKNLSFWLKFPDFLVKKVCVGANFDRLYLSSESIYFNSIKGFWTCIS